jgi:hypothetical protein
MDYSTLNFLLHSDMPRYLANTWTEITVTVPQLFPPSNLAHPSSNSDDDELEDMEEDTEEETVGAPKPLDRDTLLCIQFMIPKVLMNPHNRTGNQSTSSIQPNLK